MAYRRFYTDLSKPRYPVIANSFPKSGTHLLIQILEPLPSIRDWGYFLPSAPSYSLRERNGMNMAERISVMANHEMAGAHLHYSIEVEDELRELDAVHYFIYRDLRDVVISESYYLYCMNKWHRLHSIYKEMHEESDRLRFAIEGDREGKFAFDYPDIGTRFRKYQEWMNRPDVIAIRFEDLRGRHSHSYINEIVEYHWRKTGKAYDLEEYQRKSNENVDPHRSHTFRSGEKGRWLASFDESLKDLFKEYAGDLLIELGYEDDLNW
ncbi:MAG: hypothetical protein AAF546_00985 [Verrucomicrobiota bacterium]